MSGSWEAVNGEQAVSLFELLSCCIITSVTIKPADWAHIWAKTQLEK